MYRLANDPLNIYFVAFIGVEPHIRGLVIPRPHRSFSLQTNSRSYHVGWSTLMKRFRPQLGEMQRVVNRDFIGDDTRADPLDPFDDSRASACQRLPFGWGLSNQPCYKRDGGEDTCAS